MDKNTTGKEKLNILLIQPLFKNNLNHIKCSAAVRPMGLAYLAAYILKHFPEANIEILDAHGLNLSLKEIMEKVKSKNWGIIGISYWTAMADSAYEISEAIKKHDKKQLLIHGGVHASSMPEEASNYADYIVMHEGEETFREIVDLILKNKKFDRIKGIAYRKKGKLKINAMRRFICNLDDIPFPALHLLPLEKYNTGAEENEMHVTGGKMLPVFGSRGCPFNCSFCISPFMWQRKLRYRTAENVFKELKFNVENYKVSNFHFWDDNFIINPQFVKKLCNLIIKSKLNIKWTGLDRAESINKNKKLLKLMKKAGCVGLEIGVESANADTLIAINKGQTLNETKEAIKNQKEAGLCPLYTSMTFNIGETIHGYYLQNEFLNNAFQNARYSKIYMGQFATPYPKTPFFNQAKKHGIVFAKKWGDYTHFSINFIPNSLLDDIPVRNAGKLRMQDYLFIMKHEPVCRYDEFPKTDSAFARWAKLMGHRSMMTHYYSLCDGKTSIKEIGRKIAGKFNISFEEAVKFTAFITVPLAQLGMIKSINDKDIKIKSIINEHYLLYFIKRALRLK